MMVVMQLTKTYLAHLPAEVLSRFHFVESRSATAILNATSPRALEDIVEVLTDFSLTVEKIAMPGGNKSVIAKELDDAFRVRGWREAKFEQTLETRLTISAWKGSSIRPQPEAPAPTVNEYGGHKIDNVLGRAALDVEWNPKDGNLDRDFGNFASLHDGGVIDVGVIITRDGEKFPSFAHQLIAEVKRLTPVDDSPWSKRVHEKLAAKPYKTSTTSNFQRLVTRIERGDGRGCPILAIGIGPETYTPPSAGLEAEVRRLHETWNLP